MSRDRVIIAVISGIIYSITSIASYEVGHYIAKKQKEKQFFEKFRAQVELRHE